MTTEFATSIDEATLGGVITALVDRGFVLIRPRDRRRRTGRHDHDNDWHG